VGGVACSGRCGVIARALATGPGGKPGMLGSVDLPAAVDPALCLAKVSSAASRCHSVLSGSGPPLNEAVRLDPLDQLLSVRLRRRHSPAIPGLSQWPSPPPAWAPGSCAQSAGAAWPSTSAHVISTASVEGQDVAGASSPFGHATRNVPSCRRSPGPPPWAARMRASRRGDLALARRARAD